MSEDDAAMNSLCCCASCGIAEVDDIKKLKECDGCDLVRYCSDECQRDHKSQHEEDCKKRAAELRDKLLFRQPECSSMGDCPICTLPLPLDVTKSTLTGCCSKFICKGCAHAHQKRQFELRLVQSCPFCREPAPETEEEAEKLEMKRIEANDPVAICKWGVQQYYKGDYDTAFDYCTKAAKLGDVWAHFYLSLMYRDGEGIEQDVRKEIYHLEEAAIGGHPEARYYLGIHEGLKGNDESAVRHWIIAATQGDDNSIKMLMEGFKDGLMEKEDLASALRAHKAAVDATKSPQRKATEEYIRKYGALGI